MNEHERAELDRLICRQETLRQRLDQLDTDLQRFSAKLRPAAPPTPEVPSVELPPGETPPPLVPFPVDAAPEPASPPVAAMAPESSHPDSPTAPEPPPLPPIIPWPAAAQTHEQTHAGQAPPPFVPPAAPRRRPAASRDTFEMKLGTYWLVRVGIVMLLTGLVFLGTYAYANWIGKLQAPGKITLLYSASAALLGFGGWLQRKRERESLRNYGQVLFAGGLAAVYFTTYAAHHLEILRIITSPVVDALLLLAWSAFTVWIADRRKSEVLALFAIGLSYYTSAITDIGFFTLGSNLLLTAAAVFFLVRNQWTKLSFISILATYGGFIFWRFHHGDWSWHARVEEAWNANYFLAAYWLFFTTAVFFARGPSLTNASRATFASMNNGAFFGLVVLSMFHLHQGNFWKFSLGLGALLLLAAAAARRLFAAEPALKNAYLVQGLTLVTAGFIAYFAGLRLALVLATESVILTILGSQQRNVFMRAGGFITATLAAGWVWTQMESLPTDVLLGSTIGAAFLLNAWWARRHNPANDAAPVRLGSGYFVALAMFVSGVVTWHAVADEWRAAAWMIEAVAFTALYYALRIPELPLFSQALALAAQGWWLVNFPVLRNELPWAVPAIFLGAVLALNFLGHEQKNRVVRVSGAMTAALTTLWAFTAMTGARIDLTLGAGMSAAFLLSAWWERRHDALSNLSSVRPGSGYFVGLGLAVCAVVTWHAVPEPWRAVAWMTEALAFTALFYGVRLSELPLFAQALAVLAQGYWFFEFALKQGRPHWLVPASLIAGTLALSHWWQREKRVAFPADFRNVLQIVYALALVGVAFFWSKPNFAPAAWLAFLNVLALGLTVYGVATRAWALAACAQVFLLVSSAGFLEQFGGAAGWQFALVPMATWLALGIATTAWLAHHDTRETIRKPLLHLSVLYRGAAFAMSLWWIYQYVSAANYFWVLCATALGILLLAGLLRSREALAFSGLYLVVALAAWFTKVLVDPSVIHWPNALALLSILAAQQLTRRRPQRYAVPEAAASATMLVTGIALWTFVSRWVVLTSGAHFLLTASWAGLAAGLFALGFVSHERIHRWLGLGILTCSVARVFASDVWKLDTLYRILSFMALGIVLLALGFVYNKYQERIRQWL